MTDTTETTRLPWTETELREALVQAMWGEPLPDCIIDQVEQVMSFQEAGLMTNNEGVVLRLLDGTEYQIQILRSR